MFIKKLRLYAVVFVNLPNDLPTRLLENLRVIHQAQVKRRGLSYKAILFSSVTVPGKTFHCDKRFAVVWEEGGAEGLFDKETDPPPPEIQNSTAPPSAPGDPIGDGIFNVSNRS